MVKREFQAQIVDEFKDKWLKIVAAIEHASVEQVAEWYGGEELDKLHKRISGKVATLTENAYPAGDNDFFEKADNNFVISRALFTEIGQR